MIVNKRIKVLLLGILGILGLFFSFFYFFWLPRQESSSDVLINNPSFPKDSSRFISDPLGEWNIYPFQAIIEGYGEKDGIRYMLVSYVDSEGEIIEGKVFLSASELDRFSGLIKYAESIDKKEVFQELFLKRTRIVFDWEKGQFVQEGEVMGYIDGNNADNQDYVIPKGNGVSFAVLGNYPQSKIDDFDYCGINYSFCLFAKLTLALNNDLSSFWSGKILPEDSYIVPFFISTDIVLN